jgi:hypothetical protein
MINLLPENEKALIRKEYHFRVMAVGFGLLLCLVGVSILLLMPAYLSAYYKRQAASGRIAAFNNSETTEHKELVQKLRDIKTAATAVAPASEDVLPSNLVGLIMKYKTADNIITEIQYGKNEDGKLKATISGVAKSRQSLVTFTGGLEKDPLIQSVTLPVEDLVKDANIKFTVTVAGKK